MKDLTKGFFVAALINTAYINIAGATFFIFLICKLLDFIDKSWWFVCSPLILWLPVLFISIVIGVILDWKELK